MGGGSEVLKIDDALAIVDDFVAENWDCKEVTIMNDCLFCKIAAGEILPPACTMTTMSTHFVTSIPRCRCIFS